MALLHLRPEKAAEKAVSVIGCGYNMATDLRLSSCKEGPSNSRLVDLEIKPGSTRNLVIPYPIREGSIVVKNVPNEIKCDKGEVARLRSDALLFNQMSEKFNQEMGISGKIPSGTFNCMFDLRGNWQQDAGSVKSLAYDGWFISLFNVELERSHIKLSRQVKDDVPSSWDPAALAEFIDKYGTHIVVGVKMGGKDVIYVKQLQNSNLEPQEVQKLLKQSADDTFSKHRDPTKIHKDDRFIPMPLPAMYASSMRPSTITPLNDAVISVSVRRGGINIGQSHEEWLSTIMEAPNVMSMSFVPITSLLNGVRGNGFLSHAINLYLRYKPPIDELQQFLEFQLPRQWAPMYGDLPLSLSHKKQTSPVLRFSLMGPKLYVNTSRVDSESRPVTGIRLYLEGRRCDHLAIHLQHLSSIPETIHLTDDLSYDHDATPMNKDYLEAVNWSIFSHVYTAPVQHDSGEDTASIVTKAWFEVKGVGLKKVLFLRLGYSAVSSATIRRCEWDESSSASRKSGVFSSLISTRFSSGVSTPEKAAKVDVNSAVFPGGPPVSARAQRMAGVVETAEMVRGPGDSPGYWVVIGAKLGVDGGKISVKVKYALLAMTSEDSIMYMTDN